MQEKKVFEEQEENILQEREDLQVQRKLLVAVDVASLWLVSPFFLHFSLFCLFSFFVFFPF